MCDKRSVKNDPPTDRELVLVQGAGWLQAREAIYCCGAIGNMEPYFETQWTGSISASSLTWWSPLPDFMARDETSYHACPYCKENISEQVENLQANKMKSYWSDYIECHRCGKSIDIECETVDEITLSKGE